MKNFIKPFAVIMILTLPRLAAADERRCRQFIRHFVTSWHLSDQIFKVKSVRKPTDFFLLNTIELKTIITHMKMLGLTSKDLASQGRHAVSMRTQDDGRHKWVTTDVTSDNRTGLSRTLVVYLITKKNVIPAARYFNNHYDEPKYFCHHYLWLGSKGIHQSTFNFGPPEYGKASPRANNS